MVSTTEQAQWISQLDHRLGDVIYKIKVLQPL